MAGTPELPLVFLSVTKPSNFFPDELAVHCVKLTLHFVLYIPTITTICVLKIISIIGT